MKKLIDSGLVTRTSLHHPSARFAHLIKSRHHHVVKIFLQKLYSTKHVLVLLQKFTSNRRYLIDDLLFVVYVEHLLELKLLLEKQLKLRFDDLTLRNTCRHVKQLVVHALHSLIDIGV